MKAEREWETVTYACLFIPCQLVSRFTPAFKCTGFIHAYLIASTISYFTFIFVWKEDESLTFIIWKTSCQNKIRMFYIAVLRDYLYMSFCQFLVYTQLYSCIYIYLVDSCIYDYIPHFFLYIHWYLKEQNILK